MAYVKKTMVTRVTFEPGHLLHGLEIRSLPTDMEYLAEVSGLFADIKLLGESGLESGDATKAVGVMKELTKKMDQAYKLFASKIVSWNYQLEDEHDELVDIPPTFEGLKKIQDNNEVLTVLNEWLNALSGVSPSLGKELSSGVTSPELSELMEPLSVSLVS